MYCKAILYTYLIMGHFDYDGSGYLCKHCNLGLIEWLAIITKSSEILPFMSGANPKFNLYEMLIDINYSVYTTAQMLSLCHGSSFRHLLS